MRASTIISSLALLGISAAHPAPEADAAVDDTNNNVLEQRSGGDPTAPWVQVDDEGQPSKTLTPSASVTGDTTEIIDAAPHDLTASVFTNTYYGRVSTRTGDPPAPSATNKHGAGAFTRCFNKDGENAPLCDPAVNSTLFQGTTYYVTWDPDFFNKTDDSDSDSKSNSTLQISVRLDFLNRTTEKEAPDYTDLDDWSEGKWEKLDETDHVPAEWGFLPLTISKDLIESYYPQNVTLTLMLGESGSKEWNRTSPSIPVSFDKHRNPGPEKPHGFEHRDVAIALPVAFGGMFFILFGVCLWNRKTRRIELGDIMTRARRYNRPSARGYTGRRVRRMFNRDGSNGGGLKDEIRLDEREVLRGGDANATPLYEYSDHAAPQRPRRDSDLGSLAGTPTSPTFPDQQGAGNGGSNAFRDELRRQDEQRRQERF